MTESNSRLEGEKQLLKQAQATGGAAKIKTYIQLSGPGWLQSAITLGGGSLAGSLYLGVLGGFSLLWLQPLAMLMGIVMLGSISYVTLSTGRRPFGAINEFINPVLGWGWLVATLMANIVWCLPQFALGTAAIQQNLIPGLSGTGGKVVSCLFLLSASGTVIWFYDSGSKGIKIFEYVLKAMVGIVVLSFFGVVLKMALSPDGLPWKDIFQGLIPNLSLLNHPADSFTQALQATGQHADFWRTKIVNDQRDVMITAAATAVGINMTFLLPYSMLRKGWSREFRGLAIFDLSTGLFLPFILATGCVVIAAAQQFHTTPQPGLLEGTAPPSLLGQYQTLLKSRLGHEIGSQTLGNLSPAEQSGRIESLPQADKELAAMLVKRDAFNLAQSLERLTGKTFANYVFGIGVLGMALSTIIILMLISGFTLCEMLNLPHGGPAHRIGCYVAGIGVLGPFIWSGKTQFWLAVPTSVFGMTLLPIAYLTFLLMMNNRKLMGADLPQRRKRITWNLLMLLALGLATFGAAWSIWDKVRWTGVWLVAGFLTLALIVHFVRASTKTKPLR